MKLKTVDRTILVQSSNIDLGDVLPDYARTSILQMAAKYFGHLNSASVHFNRGRHVPLHGQCSDGRLADDERRSQEHRQLRGVQAGA